MQVTLSSVAEYAIVAHYTHIRPSLLTSRLKYLRRTYPLSRSSLGPLSTSPLTSSSLSLSLIFILSPLSTLSHSSFSAPQQTLWSFSRPPGPFDGSLWHFGRCFCLMCWHHGTKQMIALSDPCIEAPSEGTSHGIFLLGSCAFAWWRATLLQTKGLSILIYMWQPLASFRYHTPRKP